MILVIYDTKCRYLPLRLQTDMDVSVHWPQLGWYVWEQKTLIYISFGWQMHATKNNPPQKTHTVYSHYVLSTCCTRQHWAIMLLYLVQSLVLLINSNSFSMILWWSDIFLLASLYFFLWIFPITIKFSVFPWCVKETMVFFSLPQFLVIFLSWNFCENLIVCLCDHFSIISYRNKDLYAIYYKFKLIYMNYSWRRQVMQWTRHCISGP